MQALFTPVHAPNPCPDGNPYETESDTSYTNLHDGPTLARGHHYSQTAQKILGAPSQAGCWMLDAGCWMLDVGRGLGQYLQGAKDCGWRVRGIDFTPAFVESAAKRGIEVECAGPLDSEFLDEKYDCILLVNILERLNESREVFSASSNRSTPADQALSRRAVS